MSSTATPSDPRDVRPAPGPDPAAPRDLATEQRRRFGQMKFGACFLGWAAAVGVTVILTTLVGLAVAVSGSTPQSLAANPAIGDLRTAGVVGVVTVLVAEFLAFLAGGYVDGRMARFHGLRQGLGVWLWSVIATAVVVILGLSVQGRLASLRGLPGAIGQLPATSDTSVIIGVAVILGVSLGGALLGGLWGMAYHRRVDRYTGEPA